MINEYKNFLTPSECDHFIRLHFALFVPEITRNAFFHEGTEVVALSKYNASEIERLTSLLNDESHKLDKRNFINYFELVKWNTNQSQGTHQDFDYHPLTSILYLNDDFEGGETFVEDKIIKPKKGLMISFEGDKLKHGVKKITKGTRYTIPCWYKRKKKL